MKLIINLKKKCKFTWGNVHVLFETCIMHSIYLSRKSIKDLVAVKFLPILELSTQSTRNTE